MTATPLISVNVNALVKSPLLLSNQFNFGNISNQRSFLDDIAKKLHITDKEGWYNVTDKTLKKHGGLELMRMYNSRSRLLKSVYPEYLKYLNIH